MSPFCGATVLSVLDFGCPPFSFKARVDAPSPVLSIKVTFDIVRTELCLHNMSFHALKVSNCEMQQIRTMSFKSHIINLILHVPQWFQSKHFSANIKLNWVDATASCVCDTCQLTWQGLTACDIAAHSQFCW